MLSKEAIFGIAGLYPSVDSARGHPRAPTPGGLIDLKRTRSETHAARRVLLHVLAGLVLFVLVHPVCQLLRDLHRLGEEHGAMWLWWGGPFDPNGFDLNAANLALRRLR